MLPIEKPGGDAAFAGLARYQNVVFKGFNKDRTYCGGDKIKAITFNHGASDIIPPVIFTECTFVDT